MRPLCVAMIADEGYQEYIPLFLYFLKCSYPEYQVNIYFQGRLDPIVARCIARLEPLGGFAIKFLPDHEWENKQAFMSLRWVLYDAEFEDFSAVYIGDVDMLVTRENPTLLEQHLRHCESTRLPYSNRIRPNSRRFLGTHFVKVREYFPRALPLMQRYHELLLRNEFAVAGNEELLYRIIEEAGFGFPIGPTGFKIHHGVHLRVFREEAGVEFYRNVSNYNFRAQFERRCAEFHALTTTPLFQDILGDLRQIRYDALRLQKYPRGGPAALKQVGIAISLARELLGETPLAVRR